MIKTYWKVVLGILLIFALGFLAGGLTLHVLRARAVTKILTGGPENLATYLERRFTRSLRLEPEQHNAIRDYLVQNIEQRRLLQKQIQPEIYALNQETKQQIEGILKPEQLETFHANVEQMHGRFGQGIFNTPAGNGSPGPAPIGH